MRVSPQNRPVSATRSISVAITVPSSSSFRLMDPPSRRFENTSDVLPEPSPSFVQLLGSDEDVSEPGRRNLPEDLRLRDRGDDRSVLVDGKLHRPGNGGVHVLLHASGEPVASSPMDSSDRICCLCQVVG